jgi:succinate dehydrogenase / fumarate reductase cytochrome b subunit
MATNSTATDRKRPVNLNLLQLTLQLPIGGVVSIIHRITGTLLVLLTPYALYALQTSLEGPAGFEEIRASLASGVGRVAMLLALWVIVQHLYSGIRHLLMDVDVGIELAAARRAAWLTLAASVITVALLGVFL